jgi:hypothetical protein
MTSRKDFFFIFEIYLFIFFNTLLSLTDKKVCNLAKRVVTSSSFLSLIKHRNLYDQKSKG